MRNVSFIQLNLTPGGEGVLRISSDRDDRRIFGGLNFRFLDFLGWKILASILKQGVVWVLKANVSILRVVSFNAFRKFLWLGNSASDFLRVKFWSRVFFLVLFEAQRSFFWF